jgi:hypothetical protein
VEYCTLTLHGPGQMCATSLYIIHHSLRTLKRIQSPATSLTLLLMTLRHQPRASLPCKLNVQISSYWSMPCHVLRSRSMQHEHNPLTVQARYSGMIVQGAGPSAASTCPAGGPAKGPQMSDTDRSPTFIVEQCQIVLPIMLLIICTTAQRGPLVWFQF